jgi:tetratricopeptide (TPR) repeat protein
MRKNILMVMLCVLLMIAGYSNAEEHPRVLIQRGERFLAMGNLEAALANYRKVIHTYPDTLAAAEAYNDMGVIYIRQGMIEKAREAYKSSLSMADYTLAKLNLGKLYYGRFTETRSEEDRKAAILLLGNFQEYLQANRDLPAVVRFKRDEIDRFLAEALTSLTGASPAR